MGGIILQTMWRYERRYEAIFSLACHFERKREIFFVCGQEETGGHRETGNTALPTLQDQGISFGQGKRTVNEKAPYTFLFISLREPTSTPSGHILPREGGRAVSPHQSLPLGH